MKYRSDFVTNSSSSSFIVSININKKDGDRVSFFANGGTPESGRIDYFDSDAVIRVSPKQMGTAKTVEEMIKILTDGVIDGYGWYDEPQVKIFAEPNPEEVFDYASPEYDWNNPKMKTIDAYDFIKEIRKKIQSMDEVYSIDIEGEESNYMSYLQRYEYNCKTGEYTGYIRGCEFEKDGASGGEISIPDARECNIIYEDEDGWDT